MRIQSEKRLINLLLNLNLHVPGGSCSIYVIFWILCQMKVKFRGLETSKMVKLLQVLRKTLSRKREKLEPLITLDSCSLSTVISIFSAGREVICTS